MIRRSFNLAFAGLLTGVYSLKEAVGQTDLPALVTLVVPFAPGGGADVLAREFVQAAQIPGTTFVIDNKPGANGAIANRYVARQKPDGTTFLLGSSSTHALGPLMAGSDVDPVRDFSAATLLAETAMALAVSTSSPWRTLDEFVAASRSTRISYGTFGVGSSAHLYGIILARATAAKLEHVPYKGSSQAISDLVAGHVEAVLLTASALDAMAKSGKVRILAVSGERRVQSLAEVPTFKEAGIGGLEFNGWFGIFGPKAVPARFLERLSEMARSMTNDSQYTRRLAALGYDWIGSTPQALDEELARTISIYRPILATTPADELGR